MKYLILLCSLCTGITSHANPYGDTLLSNNPNSASYILNMADSLLETKDSIQAAAYFLKVDPYTLLGTIDDMAPDKLNDIFDHYKISQTGRDLYTRKFMACYEAAAKNEVYQTFKRMHTEDQAIRRAIDDAPDSIARATEWQKMGEFDSVHRIYVLEYLKKHNKWPTPEDGSYLAYILVWHDRLHPERYLPLLYKAVVSGSAEAIWYNNFVELKRDKAMGMQKRLTYPNKVAIDVSSLINDVYPSKSIKLVDKALKEHCPVKDIYFVFYSQNKATFEKALCTKHWATARTLDDDSAHMELYRHIDKMCTPKSFALDYLPSDFKKPKLIMYLFY